MGESATRKRMELGGMPPKTQSNYEILSNSATAQATRGHMSDAEIKQLVQNWKTLSFSVGKEGALSLIPGYGVYRDVEGMMKAWDDKQWVQFGFNLVALPFDALYVGQIGTMAARAVWRGGLCSTFKAGIIDIGKENAKRAVKEFNKELAVTAGVPENVISKQTLAGFERSGMALTRRPTPKGIKQLAKDMGADYAKVAGDKEVTMVLFDINNFGARNSRATLGKAICNEELKAYDEAVLEIAKKYTKKVTSFGVEEKFMLFEGASAKNADIHLQDFNSIFAQKCRQRINYKIDSPPSAKIGIVDLPLGVPVSQTKATISKGLLDSIRAADLGKKLGTNKFIWSDDLERMITLKGKDLDSAISRFSEAEKLTSKQTRGLRDFIEEEKGRKSIWAYVRKTVETDINKMEPGDGATLCAHDKTILGPRGSKAFLETLLDKGDTTVLEMTGSVQKGRTLKMMNHTFEHYFGGNIWIRANLNNTKRTLVSLGYKESKDLPFVFEKGNSSVAIGFRGAQEGGVDHVTMMFSGHVTKGELALIKNKYTDLMKKSLQPEYGYRCETTAVFTYRKKMEYPEDVFKRISIGMRKAKDRAMWDLSLVN